MYDKKDHGAPVAPETLGADMLAGDGAAALVAGAVKGHKIGRLVVAMGAVEGPALAKLAAGWRAVPMVTLITGLPEAVRAIESARPGVFYNEGEWVSYADVRGFLPWLEVWMVGSAASN